MRFDLGVRVFVARFSVMLSWVTMVVVFSGLDGSSRGTSGHGVRFAGMVTSNGGSMVHLYHKRKETNAQDRMHLVKTLKKQCTR